MALNSAYGVIAIGTAAGLALVDLVSSTQIYAWSNAELRDREHILFSNPSQSSDASPSEVCLKQKMEFFLNISYLSLQSVRGKNSE